MKTYKVLKYFQWGKLRLEKGMTVVVEDDPQNTKSAIVHVAGKQEMQGVTKIAVESMKMLKKIE